MKNINDIFLIDTSKIQRLFLVPTANVSKLFQWKVRDIALVMCYFGLFIAYYASLTPWFLWKIYRYYVFFALVPIVLSIMLSRNLKHPIFDRKDWLYPLITCAILQLSMALTSGKNINGIAMVVFSTIIYLSIFMLNINDLRKLGDWLSWSMAAILSVSIPFYLLHLVGFPLPHYHLVPTDMEYSFESYYFFLVDDRFAFDLLPRFNSVFLEPSHLGMACIGLLYTQIGKWNKLRNKIIFAGLFLTFSLAAYICLILMLFSSAWMKGKAILGKVLLLIGVCIAIVVAALVYNKGENLVNQLIVQRLSLNAEGKIEGDNRTTDIFTREYNKLANSEQVLVGKGLESFQRFGNGNAGYRVFIYCYGLISVLFVIVFFLAFSHTSNNKRAKIAMFALAILSFIPHGIPIKFYFFIPLYILTFSSIYPRSKSIQE